MTSGADDAEPDGRPPQGGRPAGFRDQPADHTWTAQSFGVDVERYDRTRARYPDALVERIVATSPGRDVLDVGSGTGIVARQLQAAGCRVLGVEPDLRMAEYARRSGVKAEISTLEAWEPGGRQFDAVVAGQAWHWVDAHAGAAQAARVLRPSGLLAVFWNVPQPPPEVAEAMVAAYEQAAPDSPINLRAMPERALDGYQVMADLAADGMGRMPGLGEADQWRLDWEVTYSRDAWLDQLPTSGALTQLAPDRLHDLLAAVGSAIDDLGGSFSVPYSTLAVVARRAVGG